MPFLFAAQPNPLMELFENNLINWFLLVALLIYLWARMTPALFQSRKNQIETALNDAAAARNEGQQFLADQEKKIASAEAEAEGILKEAEQVAREMQQRIARETEREADELRKRLEQQIESERHLAVTEMRSQAAVAAVRLAEAALPGAVSDSARTRLLNQFVDQLDLSGANTK